MIIINERNTVQKTLILEAVRSMDDHPTAEEIFEKVERACPGISRATVYRNLNRLAADGRILRVAVANAPDRFDRTTCEHSHFLCLGCGKVTDFSDIFRIDTAKLPKTDCELTGYELVFHGLCKKCMEAKNNG